MSNQYQEHLLVPMPSRFYSRHALMQLLNEQQQLLLQAIDGVRNVRELALLLASSDEQMLTELNYLIALEIVAWSTPTKSTPTHPSPRTPSTQESIVATRRAQQTPLPLHTTHPSQTNDAHRTITSQRMGQTPPLSHHTQDTLNEHPRIRTQPVNSAQNTTHDTNDYRNTDSHSFIKQPAQRLMEWEDVIIPEESTYRQVRPQHHLPPPAHHTPLPLYTPTRHATPKKTGPFTPASPNQGFKSTIKK